MLAVELLQVVVRVARVRVKSQLSVGLEASFRSVRNVHLLRRQHEDIKAPVAGLAMNDTAGVCAMPLILEQLLLQPTPAVLEVGHAGESQQAHTSRVRVEGICEPLKVGRDVSVRIFGLQPLSVLPRH